MNESPILNERQLRIVRLCNLTAKEIAQRLNMSEGTVKVYLTNIYDRLDLEPGAGAKAKLIMWALRNGHLKNEAA